MSTDISITHAEIKPVTSSEVKEMRSRLDAVTSVSNVEGIPAAEDLVRSLELLRGPANSLAKREDTDSAHAVAIAVRDHLKDARLYLRHLRQRAGISPSTGKRKAPAPTFKPSTPAEWEAAKARRTHNLAVALRGAEAGAVFLALNGKVPLTSAFPQVDSSMTVDVRGAAVAKAKAKGHDPHSIGSTSSARTLKSWQAVNGELAFGISPGLVGALVIDCDDVDGAAFTAFLAQNEETLNLSRVPVTVSGRGGRHYWFANPDGIGCGKLSTLCADLKGVGGQVVAPGMMIAPKVDAAGKAVGAARHYQALPDSLDLWTALRTRTLPPLPASLAKLIAERGTKSSVDNFDADAKVQAALDALSAGPSADKPVRDVEAMAETLRAEDPAFADVWDNGDPDDDHSTGRFVVAGHMLRRYTSHGFDVFDNAELMTLWEHAGVYRDRDVGREWARNIPAYDAKPTDAEGFGPVDDGFDPLDLDVVRERRDAIRLHEIIGAGLSEARSDVLALSHAFDAAGDYLTASRLRKVDLSDSSAMAAIEALVAPSLRDPSDPEPPPPPAAKVKPKASARFLADIVARPLPTVTQLVKGVLTAGEIVVAAGSPGAGKSADLLHLGLCIAEGKPYHGRPTKRGGVLFVGSENTHEDERRIHASMKHYGRDPHAPFVLQPACATLYEQEGKATAHEAGVIALAATIRERSGLPCRLVVIDNLRRVISPGSANDEAHATIVMKALERIRNATGASVIIIHHTIRDGSRFAGSGAIESHADAVWRFAPPAEVKKGEPRPSTIAFDKLRLGDKRQVLEYRFGFEVVAHDDDGDEIRTVVALDADSARTAGAVEADFGAVADDGTPGLDGWHDAREARGGPESPTVQNAPDPRTVAILAALADLGAGGATFQALAVLDTANAKLTAGDRKAPRMSLRALQIALAELKEAGRVVRTGTGKLTAYSLPEAAPE